MLGALVLLAQCCKGAESDSAVSKNGRFKVEAIALVPGSHGPSPFRYRWSERRPGGGYGEISSFEVTYASTAHFHMRLFVSPTGNGFLVQSSIATSDLIFYTPSGEKLYTVDSVVTGSERVVSADGATLELTDLKDLGPAKPAAVWKLFLPLGRGTGGAAELLKPPKPAELEPHVSKLDDDDPRVREKAVDAIVAMGSAAGEAIEKEIGRAGSAEARGRMMHILKKIQLKTRGHAHPHRNLLLLAAALSHPDEAIAAVARERLRAVLPREATPDAAWVESHLDRLRWDDERQAYR